MQHTLDRSRLRDETRIPLTGRQAAPGGRHVQKFPFGLHLIAWVVAAHLLINCAPAAPPNILMIVSEDNGPELGCYGDRYAKTPHLDSLARQGARFVHACVTQAGCSQSRASLLTGLYPHQHGQIGLATWGFRMYRNDTPNLPRSLKAAGYRTGIIGKLHINPESAFPFDFKAIASGNFARRNLSDYAKHAQAFMERDDTPFFLSVNYPDAHAPWLRQVDGLPKEPLTAADVKPLPYFVIDTPELREQVADYYNCLSRLDSLVGDLLEVLDRAGKSDNTIVIYLGDHGADFLRGKRTCYEGGTRIPLLLRWPGRVRPQVREELVSTIDLMPTLLAVSGAEPVPQLPGRSLVPLMTGEASEWREYLFTEYHTHAAAQNFYPQRAVRNDRYKLIESLLLTTENTGERNPGYDFTIKKFPRISGAIQVAAPHVREAYRVLQQPPRYELYDLQSDPHEFRNLVESSEHRAVLAELKQQLAAWRAGTHDPLLQETSLRRLKAEVAGLKKKDAKRHAWDYPSYFFGHEPGSAAANAPPPVPQKRSKESAPR